MERKEASVTHVIIECFIKGNEIKHFNEPHLFYTWGRKSRNIFGQFTVWMYCELLQIGDKFFFLFSSRFLFNYQSKTWHGTISVLHIDTSLKNCLPSIMVYRAIIPAK